ncbi:hypothetical protein HI914_05220 [Erysiphe necator]|nr:hypothetical protein HI914_05220 [Erysiphe necator]
MSSSRSTVVTNKSNAARSSGSSRGIDPITHLPRVELMRCSRCTKSVEVDPGTKCKEKEYGMVSFGYNLWYCERCARIVGYK